VETPPPTTQERCGCLKWDYEPSPELAGFELLATREPGPPVDVVTRVPAVPALVTEVPCEALGLYLDGRYVVAVRAFGREGEVSDLSETIVLEVKQRVIYVTRPVEGTCTQHE
jgi:hypothetical protein